MDEGFDTSVDTSDIDTSDVDTLDFDDSGLDDSDYNESDAVDDIQGDTYKDDVAYDMDDDIVDDMPDEIEEDVSEDAYAEEMDDMEGDMSDEIEEDVSEDAYAEEMDDMEGDMSDEIAEDVSEVEESNATDEMTEIVDNNTAYQNLADYMSEHNYGMEDYDEYSKDPEWQKLHQEAYPEWHEENDVNTVNTDNVEDDTGMNPTEDNTAYQNLADYMSEHNYGMEDYDEYSKDPEWQKLHQQAYPEWHKDSEINEELDESNNESNENIHDAKTDIADDIMKNYDVGKADFSDFDSDVAKSVSNAIKDAKVDFPDLKIDYIGSIDTQVAGIRTELTDYYRGMIKDIPDLGWDNEKIEKVASFNADKFIKQAGLDDTDGTFAWSLNVPKYADPTGGGLSKYNGVAINKQYASDNAKFTVAKIREVATKHKPIGCGTPRATVDHELGHEIDKLLNANGDDEINKMYNEMMDSGKAEERLSGYSKKNVKEFIAECYSEYRNNPTPREYSSKVYQRLKYLYGQQKGVTKNV